MEQSTASLSNLQLELLKLFSYQLPEEELIDLKKILAGFFSERLKKRTSSIWKEKGYTQEDMDKWLNDENQ